MPFSQLNWNGRLTRSAIGFDSFFASSALLVSSSGAAAGAAAGAADESDALAWCADAFVATASRITVKIARRALAVFMTRGGCLSLTPGMSRDRLDLRGSATHVHDIS